MAQEDRDALRFLWVDDPFKTFPEVTPKGRAFGVSATIFLLNATIEDCIEQHSFSRVNSSPNNISRVYKYINSIN